MFIDDALGAEAVEPSVRRFLAEMGLMPAQRPPSSMEAA